MHTIAYTDYSPAAVSRASLHREPAAEGSSLMRYVGLSPFEVPEQVDVEVQLGNRLAIVFHYPNQEPIEPIPCVVSADGAIKAFLCLHSRKISELTVDHATERLFGGQLQFDEDEIQKCFSHESHDVSVVARRNFEVINSILKSMPRRFRELLAASLREKDASDAQSETAAR